MTKLEFLDKINDILIGLNTAESDALGSLYDELMRDNNWQQVRIQAAIAAMQAESSNPNNTFMACEDKDAIIAKRSVKRANALIEELKKGGQDE